MSTKSNATIEVVTDALKALTAQEISDRLRLVNAERRALTVLLRSAKARERILNSKSAPKQRGAGHAE